MTQRQTQHQRARWSGASLLPHPSVDMTAVAVCFVQCPDCPALDSLVGVRSLLAPSTEFEQVHLHYDVTTMFSWKQSFFKWSPKCMFILAMVQFQILSVPISPILYSKLPLGSVNVYQERAY